MRHRDTQSKKKMKQNADNKPYVKPSKFQIGDQVLLKEHSCSKPSTPYNPVPLTVIQKKGIMVTARRDGNQCKTRNSSFFKHSPRVPPTELFTDFSDVEADTSPNANTDHAQHNTNPDKQSDNLHPPVSVPNIPESVTAPHVAEPRRSGRTLCLPKKFNDCVLT